MTITLTNPTNPMHPTNPTNPTGHEATDPTVDSTPSHTPVSTPDGSTADGAGLAARFSAYGAALFTAAIFGFFYAWVCSTMWGLDAADPRVAIEAMQEMNASVRNAVFFPAFFLTPVVAGLAALFAHRSGRRRAARLFGAAGIVYLLGGLVLTMTVNVPMNEDLATVVIPAAIADAEQIWSDYSGRWQVFNIARTVASGVSLLLVAVGIGALGARTRATA